MLNWLKQIFPRKPHGRRFELSEEFLEARESYIQLVKSRIIEALVTDYLTLLPQDASADQRFALMLALCAYFSTRTDYELERRKVMQSARDEVWPHVLDAVLREMEITGKVAEVARIFILKQMDLIRGMIEAKEVDDIDAFVTTLEILCGTAVSLTNAQVETQIRVSHSRVEVLLDKYAGYSGYLDTMATEVYVDA